MPTRKAPQSTRTTPTIRQKRQPTYRRHSSGQALVELDGQRFYLGRYGTPESRAAYDELIARWLAHGRKLPEDAGPDLTIAELIEHYLTHAETYYVKNGQPTTEVGLIELAVRPLAKLYGSLPAREFGPQKFKLVREQYIEGGVARSTANHYASRLKRLFRWGVAEELVPPAVSQALAAVPGLKSGRSEARETEPVRPASEAHFEAVKPYLSRQVAAMLELEMLTGMRSSEVCQMRTGDLDTSGELWCYVPGSHKAEHHGRKREIWLGARAQDVLRPFLKTDLEAHCFSPREAEAERLQERHANRVTPMSCGNVPGSNRKRRPKRKLNDHYTAKGIGRALTRACRQAFPPPEHLVRRDGETDAAWKERLGEDGLTELRAWWREHHIHPHQIRHTVATHIRKDFGLDAARAFLGHANAAITEIYAERDAGLAREVARRIG